MSLNNAQSLWSILTSKSVLTYINECPENLSTSLLLILKSIRVRRSENFLLEFELTISIITSILQAFKELSPKWGKTISLKATV